MGTKKSTRRSEKSSSALKSTNLTQAVSRTTASGSDTTPEVPVRTCTESTEMFPSHSPSPRCTEKWPLDIELDQVPSRFSEPNRSNPTSADDHKTNRCTNQTSSTKYKSKNLCQNFHLYLAKKCFIFSVIHVH